MTLSEDVLRIWMKDARRQLRRYRDHSHWEDIAAEAYLTMWEAISRAQEDSIRDLHGYAMRAAWNGAQGYLSSPANEHRTYNVYHRTEVIPSLSLEAVVAGHYPEWCPRGLVEPDFVPRLIERLAALEELARVEPSKRAALILCCLEEMTREEARLQLGWPRWKIDRVLRRVSSAAIPYAHPGGSARRGSHCAKGHPLSGENITRDGRCRACRLAKNRAYYHNQKARNAA